MGKKNLDNGPIKGIDTIIGKDTTVKGRIDAEGGIRVDGKFEGQIFTSGDVIVGETGSLVADVEAKNISIAGEVRGNVLARGKLELIPTGKLFGDVRMAILVVEDGAVFQGQCEMLNPEGDLRERGRNFKVQTPAVVDEAAASKPNNN